MSASQRENRADDGNQETLPLIRACPNPVFVIGSPRSGTTVLACSLGKHSDFADFGESQILSDLFGDGRLDANYRRAGRPDGSWLLQRGVSRAEFLQCIGMGLNVLFTRQSAGRRWIDQTPNYTLFADTVADMFPGAQFLHIIRDGRRAVHSMINYPIKAAPWAKDFTEACHTWQRFVSAALEFDGRHAGRCLTVVNEALVADAQQGFRSILEFLGATTEPGPAQFFVNNRINSSFPSKLGNDRNAGQVTTPEEVWSNDQKAIFDDVAGESYAQFRMLISKENVGEAPK